MEEIIRQFQELWSTDEEERELMEGEESWSE